MLNSSVLLRFSLVRSSSRRETFRRFMNTNTVPVARRRFQKIVFNGRIHAPSDLSSEISALQFTEIPASALRLYSGSGPPTATVGHSPFSSLLSTWIASSVDFENLYPASSEGETSEDGVGRCLSGQAREQRSEKGTKDCTFPNVSGFPTFSL
jgi:hypothetical protein